MSLHPDTLSRFQTNQSLLLLLKAVWLAEKQQIPILVFGFETSTLIITPLVVIELLVDH
jgi:hypothetical protein